MLDLRKMRVLREVVARGSFSAAAERLFVSQSAVSQQIAALESEVGTPLLLRLRGGPIPTDAGRLLIAHADAAIGRLEQAERELAELAGLAAGELRMISFPSASSTLVTAAASAFSQRFPGVRLSLVEGDPEDSIPALKRGDHDLAIVYDFELQPFEDDRDLELTPLITERMHVVLSAAHPLAGRSGIELCELDSESWLCGTTTTTCRELTIRSCRSAGFEPDVAFESNDYTAIQSLVAAGLGVTLMPDLALVRRHPDLAVVPVVPVAPVRRVWAATAAAGSPSRAAASMIEVLVEAGVGLIPAAGGEPALAA